MCDPAEPARGENGTRVHFDSYFVFAFPVIHAFRIHEFKDGMLSV
jgi:hypothetical protein